MKMANPKYINFKKWLLDTNYLARCPDAVGYVYAMNKNLEKRMRYSEVHSGFSDIFDMVHKDKQPYEKWALPLTSHAFRYLDYKNNLVAMDEDNVLFCECKYTEKKFDEKELKDLIDSSVCINRKNKWFMIFSKSGITAGVKQKIEGDSVYSVITLDQLF